MLSTKFSNKTFLAHLMKKYGPKVYFKWWPPQAQSGKLPGPKAIPLFGNFLQVHNKRIEQKCTLWKSDYGSLYQIKLFGKKIVVISDAGLLRQAFADGDLNKHLNDRSVNSTQHVFCDRKHVGFADFNKETQCLKEILRRQLKLFQMDVNRFQKWNKSVIEAFVIKCACQSKTQNINPDVHIKQYLTDLNSVMLIGETLPEDDPDSNALWELIDLLYTLLDPSIDAPLRALPFLRFLPGKYGNIFRNTIKARDNVARRYFDSQKLTYQNGQVRGLVDLCLKIQADEIREKGQSWLTDDYIKGLMYDTVAAGMSEMMKSIRMLILLMCHYPEVQSRVHTEIDDVIGSGATPSSQHRSKMPYTEAVIMEMLRYVSQTPLAIPHKCNKDVILDGYLIEKDSGIFPNIWGIHHDEKIWTDPWVFRPERFIAENGQLLPKDHKLRKTLIPFSVGKRRCPGEDFAMSRLFLLFTSMIQRLQFCPPSAEELPSADPRLYTNKYPLHLPKFTCRATPR